MTDHATILVEQRGAVTLVTLNRPEALNALSSAVLEDLIAAFAAFEGDATQRCAVVTGAGEKAFAAGADIREMAVRTAGAAIPTGSRSRIREETGAWSPRDRRWSPYTSNRAERAFTGHSPRGSLPHVAASTRRNSSVPVR